MFPVVYSVWIPAYAGMTGDGAGMEGMFCKGQDRARLDQALGWCGSDGRFCKGLLKA